MNVVPEDSRYVPLTQQRWCCVPTCFQMVMLRHKLPLVPAELIGYHMGLVVPPDGEDFFWNPRASKERPPAGYGTQANKPEYGPNAVFKKLNIPLKLTWSLINKFSNIDEFKKYLEVVETNDIDVLACFDWGTLFDHSDFHNGHVCVVDRIYIEKNEVRIIDPEWNVPKWRVVSIDKLFESMKFHGQDKSGGFWEVNKI